MKIKLSELKDIIREELILQEERKLSSRSASKTDGPPPYREQGSTESQAQQMAAGIAYSARMKRGKARKAAERKIKSYGGAAWALYSGEITNKELKNLAKLGQKVKGHKAKEPKHRKSLPGHVTPSKRKNENVNDQDEEVRKIQPDSTIYVDMDGVVVDFHTPMIAEINSILEGGLPDFLKGSKTSRRALRKIKDQMGEEYRATKKIDLHNPLIRELTFSIIKRKPYDYFVNLGQMKDGVEMLWPYVTSLPYRIEMLTASVQGLDPEKKTAEDAKKDWVATHLDPQPAAVNVVPGVARKIPYATSNGVPNVLIDDRSDTIAKWNEAGGIGILHTTGNSASTAQRLKDVAAQAQEATELPEEKNEEVLEAVLNRLLKEQDDLTTPGDLIWKGYLGWSVPKDQVGDVASVPEEMISNRIQRDNGEDKFHITIISPVEVRAIANKIRDEQGLSGGKSKKEAKRQLFLAAAE